MKELTGIAASVVAAMFACTTPALAQSAPATSDREATQELPENFGYKPAPTPADGWQPLLDEGITLSFNYTQESAANLTGGLRKGSAYAGQLYVGADFDTDKLFHLDGGTVHVAITQRHGHSLIDYAIGSSTSTQEIAGVRWTRLALLSYEQKFFDDKLSIEVGRAAANNYILTSPYYCNFIQNSSCGAPVMVFKDSNLTYFPAPSWMAQMTAHFGPNLYFHTGVYEVNPDRKVDKINDFRLGIKNATGVIVPFEFGYGTDFTNDRLPRHYMIGGWVDRSDYADPYLDDDGAPAVLTGNPARTRHGRSGMYVRFDQRLTRPDPTTERGLGIFAVAMKNLSGRVIESYYLEAGVVQTGTFKGRDRDTVGFVINDQHFSDLGVASIKTARASVGASTDVPKDMIMMEAAYGAQIGNAVRVGPHFQYIIHPDQQRFPFRTSDIGDAFVVGMKLTIDGPLLIQQLFQSHRQ